MVTFKIIFYLEMIIFNNRLAVLNVDYDISIITNHTTFKMPLCRVSERLLISRAIRIITHVFSSCYGSGQIWYAMSSILTSFYLATKQ